MKSEDFPFQKEIREISRKIIKERFPEELNFFEMIWNVMKTFFNNWKNINPEEWTINESKEKLMSDLGFSDISQVIDLVTPGLVTTLSATMTKIKDFGYIPCDEEIEKIIDEYAQTFGVRRILISIIKKYFKDLCEIMPQILDVKKEKVAIKTIQKEAYARVWTLKTKDSEGGDIFSKEDYEDIWKRKRKVPLLIIKTNGFRNIYLYGNEEDITLLHYDLLEYVLKHKGKGGDALNLLANVWKLPKLAESYRLELEDAKKKGNEKVVKAYIYKKTGRIRNAITKLNSFLLGNLNLELKTRKKGQYMLTKILEYYLIEII